MRKCSKYTKLLFSLLLTAGIVFASWPGKPPANASEPVFYMEKEKGWHIYWGDTHGHTAYSQDAKYPPDDVTNGIDETPADALAYARDPAGGNLDFLVFTDHAEAFVKAPNWNEADMIARYQDMISVCKENKNSKDIVVFPGFEYTNSQLPSEGHVGYGHKCIFIKDPDAINSRPIPSPSTANDAVPANSIDQLWTEMNQTAGIEYMTIPHHPAKGITTERGSDWFMGTDWSESYVNGKYMPIAEIYSVHGSSEMPDCEEQVKDFRNDNSVEAALRRWITTGDEDYKLGLIGSTDNHKAKPGSVAELAENVHQREGPFTGGLAAVWADEQNRNDIWTALKTKSTYATSGSRIKGEVTALSGSSTTRYYMGDTITALKNSYPDVILRIVAESDPNDDISGNPAGIWKIIVYKNTVDGTEAITFTPDSPEWSVMDKNTQAVRVLWTDHDSDPDHQQRYYRVKIFQNETPIVNDSYIPDDDWDEGPHETHERAWLTPIWFDASLEETAQPDLLIKKSIETEYIGNNIYNNLTAQGITEKLTSQSGKSAAFNAVLQNDGDETGTYTLSCLAANTSGWKYKIKDANGKDITSKIKKGLQVEIPGKGSASYQVTISYSSSKSTKKDFSLTLLAERKESGASDGVKMICSYLNYKDAKISITPDEKELSYGDDAFQFQAAVTPAGFDQTVEWSLGDDADGIAAIDKDTGIVTVTASPSEKTEITVTATSSIYQKSGKAKLTIFAAD